MIAILDYDMSNLRSVAKAFERLGATCKITRDKKEILAADKLVVPGQGAFADCMRLLKDYELIDTLKEFMDSGKPYLGLCLGMQILMESSDEAPGVEGLGVFKGGVERFSPDLELKVPHMGWNNLLIAKESRLLQGLPEASYVYFVHSYYVTPQDKRMVAANCHYGIDFPAAFEHKNIFATQFHPEKSQKIGLHILKNFTQI